MTDPAAEASLARWLVRLEASGEVPAIVEQVRGLVVAPQVLARTVESVTVDVVRFGYAHLRVPSRSAKDARERVLATWRAEVLVDLEGVARPVRTRTPVVV